MKKTIIIGIIIFTAICCKTKDPKPEVDCLPTELQGTSIFYNTSFTFDENRKPISAIISDIPVKFDYTGSNITKMNYSDENANRVVTIEYDSKNRPVKANKVYNSDSFSYNAVFNLQYDNNGRLYISKVNFTGDFEIDLTIRLEYDTKGNVLKEFLKENNNPEYLFIENSGFDNKKHPYSGMKLNPLNLFFEPVNLYDCLSENNPTVQKSLVKDSEYIGSYYNMEVKYTFKAYNENGYPTELTSDVTIIQPENSDPNAKLETIKSTENQKYSYLCK